MQNLKRYSQIIRTRLSDNSLESFYFKESFDQCVSKMMGSSEVYERFKISIFIHE